MYRWKTWKYILYIWTNKILNYCNESCKSCKGEKENDCNTCYRGYKLVDGKCKNEM